MRYRLLAIVLLGGFLFAAWQTGGASAAPADLVLQHGTVLTMDAQDHVAQALAVRGGRLVAVGSDRDIAALIGPRTRVIDLHGRTATPGLIDTHAHVLLGKLVELYQLDLSRARSVGEILARVKARAASSAPGVWVSGDSWNESIIAEHRAPTLAELDAVSGDHPVRLGNITGHYAMVNSKALALMHVGKGVKDPPHGTIDRDAGGNPTGMLRENAQDLVVAIMPPPSPAMRQAAIRAALRQMASEGMTGVKDPDLQPQEWAAYLALARKGPLTAHVCALIHAGDSLASARKALAVVRQAQKDVAALAVHDLDICGVKIYMDGSVMAHTAWMNAPYPADKMHPGPPNHGYPTVEPGVYRQMIDLFTREGVTVGTHVIGDRGTDFVADTYAQALAKYPRMGLRHSLIHAYLQTPHALDTIAMVQKRYDSAILEVQPEFIWTLGGTTPGILGPKVSQRLMPLASFARRGLIYASSSDYSVTPLPARLGLAAAVTRESESTRYGRQPFGTAEAANVHDALRSYTIWAAHQMFAEKQTGSLEAGKWADIAVWDINPYAVPAGKLRDMRCLMTFYKGREVFGRN